MCNLPIICPYAPLRNSEGEKYSERHFTNRMRTSTSTTRCLLLVFAIVVVIVNGQSYWSKKCNKFSRARGVRPLVDAYAVRQGVGKAECKAECAQSGECGSFVMLRVEDRERCLLYHLNDQIIKDYLPSNWYSEPLQVAKWFSKTCPYTLDETVFECTDYRVRYTNRYIGNEYWMLLGGTTLGIPGLTAEQCQQWCTLYKECRSVLFVHSESEGHSQCRMYSATIPEVEERGLDEDIEEYVYDAASGVYNVTTYDRNCYLPYMNEI